MLNKDGNQICRDKFRFVPDPGGGTAYVEVTMMCRSNG